MENKKSFGVNFKGMLSDAAEINNMFCRLGFLHLQVEKILSNYEKDINRNGVVLLVNDKLLKKSKKIIIDAIDGEPNSNQVKELTYDEGSDCDKRFILYTKENQGYVKNEYRYEQEMVKSFAKVNNDCGFDTYLVKVSLGPVKTYQYDFSVCPEYKKRTSITTLPTKQEFEKAVFKVFYNQTDQFLGYEHDYMYNIDDWFSGTHWYVDHYHILFKYPIWDENGLFVQADSVTHGGADELNIVKENKQKYLDKMFVNREISFETVDSGKIRMLIKLWDMPLSFFTNASTVNKEKIAEYLRFLSSGHLDEYWSMRHYLDGSQNEIVETEMAISEDTFNELENEISA